MKINVPFSIRLGRYHGGGRVLERSRSNEGDQASELGAIIR